MMNKNEVLDAQWRPSVEERNRRAKAYRYRVARRGVHRLEAWCQRLRLAAVAVFLAAVILAAVV